MRWRVGVSVRHDIEDWLIKLVTDLVTFCDI